MSDPLFDVSDQVVLVSGGTRGIGRAISQGFAERKATVIVTGTRQETVDEALDAIVGESVHGLVCDVADPQAIRTGVEHVITAHGRIDTLVNCAGVNRRKPALEVTEEDYDFILDINLKGAYIMS